MSDQHVDHLIVALLAVGGYSLQRAWDLLDNLRREGLADSKAVARMDEGEVVRRLARAGYDRGPTVTTSMASRLTALHSAVRAGTLARAAPLISQGHIDKAREILCGIKGVGPVVFRNFAALEGAPK